MVKSRNEVALEQANVQNNAKSEENYFGDSSSVCSQEASNYPEDDEFVSNLRATFERRRRNASKKCQVARKPKLSKKKSKSKLDKKMRVLRQLIPNSSNVDNACVLDEAIVYIKILQSQLQFIMSANALTTGMYISRMQTLAQPHMTHQFYGSSVVQNDILSSLWPSLIGNRIQMPPLGMFNYQPPSLMSNSSLSFSPYGSLMMMPFQE